MVSRQLLGCYYGVARMFWVVARRLQVDNWCVLGNFKDFADSQMTIGSFL